MDKHPVDKIFHDAFYHQEMEPPPGAWVEIEDQLRKGERKRYIIFWRTVAAVALVLCSLTAGYFIGINRQVKELVLADNQASVKETTEVQNAEIVSVDKSRYSPDRAVTSVSGQSEIIHERSDLIITSDSTASDTPIHSIKFENDNKLVRLAALDAGLVPAPEFIPEIQMPLSATIQENEEKEYIVSLDEMEDEEQNDHRWSLGGQMSPLYAFRDVREKNGSSVYRASASTYSGSALSVSLDEYPLFSYSGGLNLNYSITEDLQVQSGVSWSSTGMGTSANMSYMADVYSKGGVFSTLDRNLISVGQYVNNSTGNIEALRSLMSTNGVGFSEKETASISREATVVQYLGYLEIPIVLKYHLMGRKIRFGVSGGLITNILADNKVFYETQGKRVDAGSAGDLQTLNCSGAVGLEASLPVGDKWHFNLEPSFRYFINPIYSTSSFDSHPYSFGVFTGVSYSF